MKILIVIPTQIEYDLFLKNCVEKKFLIEETTIGRLPVIQFPDLEMTLAHGGLGKVQFAIHTQHLLDSEPGWDLVMCVGAAGALTDDLSIGDIVVAAETIEHDIKNEFGEPLMPRYKGDETAIETLRGIGLTASSFKLHFGSIASGDEDVVDVKRKKELRLKTGAIAVAWEGAGGARACQFSDIPFIEIRGISDGADTGAASDFEANLPGVMKNIVMLVDSLVKIIIHDSQS